MISSTEGISTIVAMRSWRRERTKGFSRQSPQLVLEHCDI